MAVLDRYNASYFEARREPAEHLSWAKARPFAPHISKTDTVIDFGCGGGWLIEALDCAKKDRRGAEPYGAAGG